MQIKRKGTMNEYSKSLDPDTVYISHCDKKNNKQKNSESPSVDKFNSHCSLREPT